MAFRIYALMAATVMPILDVHRCRGGLVAQAELRLQRSSGYGCDTCQPSARSTWRIEHSSIKSAYPSG
ncbi:MAG: hypothetical protein AAF354_14600, partial [Pseudomonadota bacterium]